MSGILNLAVQAYFLSASAAVLLAQLWSRPLRPLLVYGKTAGLLVKDRSTSSDLVSVVSAWHVPRAWFRHFYILSTFLGLLILSATTYLSRGSERNVLLLLSHSVRRLYECHYVERPSGSKMWIGHYLVGISFYIFVNLAMVSHNLSCTSEPVSAEPPWLWLCVGGVFVAQVCQHLVHRQLANIRASCRPGEYRNPKGGFFRYVIAPHYTAEIFLYLCIALLDRHDPTLWLVTLWTVSILGTSALQTDSWGRQKFKDWGTRWILVPGIL